MRFHVIDTQTGKPPDLWEIAKSEDWAQAILWGRSAGFAIDEGGNLIALDRCGRYCFCLEERFQVVIDDAE